MDTTLINLSTDQSKTYVEQLDLFKDFIIQSKKADSNKYEKIAETYLAAFSSSEIKDQFKKYLSDQKKVSNSLFTSSRKSIDNLNKHLTEMYLISYTNVTKQPQMTRHLVRRK